MTLLLISVLLSTAGAILALVFKHFEKDAKIIGCTFGAIAAVLSTASGVLALLGNTETLVAPTPFFDFELLLNPLSGLLLTIISVLAFAAWIYGISYFDEYKGKDIGLMCFFMNIFVASMNLVVTADNAFWFLLFFEMMSLSSYFLVVTDQDKASLHGGFMYLVMAHVGFFMIMIAFFIMAGITGSFSFSAFREGIYSAPVASLIFMLAFLGFSVKAGMMPFHSWLPLAHPAAPSNVSALMSGAMIKIGIFGTIKVGFDLLANSGCQLWWGLVVVLFGAISAVLGVIYAINEKDVKKMLAYCSVENIGIILMGVGVALTGWAVASPTLVIVGLVAALFHMLNHAMFKGLLFFGAGSLLYSTHTRDVELMGGLSKLMPVTSFCFLVGSLAISALPPLNGFVSEWFTYQALITAAFQSGPLIKTICAFAVVMLAITGALAATLFVKAYGVAFLGAPKTDAAKNAKEVPGSMKFSMVFLAIIVIALGLGAPWVVPVFENAAASISGFALAGTTSGAMLVSPGLTDSLVSTPLLAVLLVAAVLIPIAVCRGQAAGTKNTPDPWACGYLPTEEMNMNSASFASSTRMFFKKPYIMRDGLLATVPSWYNFFYAVQRGCDKIQNWGDFCLVEPVKKFTKWVGKWFSKLQGGDFRVYIVYVVITLIVLLIIAAIVM